MVTKSFLRYVHTAEVYKKTITTNEAGQNYSSYTLLDKVPVVPQSRTSQFTAGSIVRTVPYQEYIPPLEIIFPGMYGNIVVLTCRIGNIKDRYGNIVEAGPFEIVSMQPKFGFNGKKSHIVAQLRSIVEQS
jgi:hypothetical protein